MVQYKAKPTSRNKLANYALFFRKLVGLDKDLHFPIIEFIEFVLPIIDPNFDLEIIDECDFQRNTYALTYPDAHKMMIRSDFFYVQNTYEDDLLTCLHVYKKQ